MNEEVLISVGKVLTVKQISCKIDKFQSVTRNYMGIENNKTQTIIDNKNNTIEVKLKSSNYANRLDFPNIGDSGIIYIDEENNKSYRWDNLQLIYKCIGSDYNDIEIINGGVAKWRK